jgi:hypothetical protein
MFRPKIRVTQGTGSFPYAVASTLFHYQSMYCVSEHYKTDEKMTVLFIVQPHFMRIWNRYKTCW